MNVNALINGRNRIFKLSAFSLFLIAGALVGWRWMNIGSTDLTTPVYAQNDALFERRISQVEQRFYYIESRLNQLESQSRYPTTLPGSSTQSQAQLSQIQNDIDSLRVQMDSLRSRVGEVECGLMKVDERTLSAAARQARRQSAQGQSELCRADPSAPVKLSARP
jgi:hypothetical protein